MRATILVGFIIAAAIAGPWAAQAAPASSTPTPPISTDGNGDGTGGGNQDHVVGEDMC